MPVIKNPSEENLMGIVQFDVSGGDVIPAWKSVAPGETLTVTEETVERNVANGFVVEEEIILEEKPEEEKSKEEEPEDKSVKDEKPDEKEAVKNVEEKEEEKSVTGEVKKAGSEGLEEKHPGKPRDKRRR